MEDGPSDKSGLACSQARRHHPKKHECADCRICQLCSDARCNCCRSAKTSGICSKMSFSEQIRLYEQTNANDPLLAKRRK